MEYEIRILEIEKEKWIQKLENMGAKKVMDCVQERCVYDFSPVVSNKWIRLRTNGTCNTLTIKEILDKGNIDGTSELEIEVSDFHKTKAILEELGYIPRSYQVNERIRYLYKDIEIDIDTWPLIPTFVEIEGKSKEDVLNFLKLIDYNPKHLTTLDIESIYLHYGIVLDYKVLTFKEQIR